MSKIYYAPRPIILGTYTANHRTIGYIVDLVDIKSEETMYNHNEKKSTHFNVNFPYRRDTYCTYTNFKIKKNELCDTFDRCVKLVNEMNDDLYKELKGNYPLDKLNEYEDTIKEYKSITDKEQTNAKAYWEWESKHILGEDLHS